MSTVTKQGCCAPQTLSIDNTTGYISISDGNSIYLGDIIDMLGIVTPVIDFSLNGYLLTLTYTSATGTVVVKTIDLTDLANGGGITVADTLTLNLDLTNAILSGNVNVSMLANNAIVINPDGLYVNAQAQLPINTTDTSTIAFLATGQFNTQLSANVKISSDLTNQLTVVGDGLYVPDNRTYISAGNNITLVGSGTATTPYIISAGGFSNIPLSVVSSPSITLSTSGAAGHTLTANTNISAATGNALVLNTDGLFVSTSIVNNYTDAQARAAISSQFPIIYNNISGIISIAQSNSTQDGYLSSVDWVTFNNKVSGGANLGSVNALPIYDSETNDILGFNAIRAGIGVSITQTGHDLIISANGTGGTGSNTLSLDFIVGDGGPFTPAAGAVTFSPSVFSGKTILGVWVEGVKIAPVVRTGGSLYYTYTASSGTLTLSQPFEADAYYSFLYR